MTTPPVFIDLETRSGCDLRVEGGHRYALDASTRLLTVAWTADAGATYHVWFPGGDRPSVAGVADSLLALHLPGVTVHWRDGTDIPDELLRVADRPWVAHNAWTFDRTVWAECAPEEAQPPCWFDTYPMALACGLPGGLNKIGLQLWGEGKYEPGNAATKKASRCTKQPGDSDPQNVPIAQQIMVARYNVQDVRLLATAWPVLQKDFKLPEHEREVLQFHDSCNSRGVKVDRPFVEALVRLADEAKGYAVEEITELTGGALNESNIGSRPQVIAWINKMGVAWGSGKGSLTREVVARFVESSKADEEEDAGDDEESEDDRDSVVKSTAGLATVARVLQLRMQALRVTQGKLQAALNRASPDDRVRYWAAYWAAHTGRFAGRGLQPHNFPRPKEGVDPWAACALYERSKRPQPDAGPPVRFDYWSVRNQLPLDARGADGKKLYPFLSVDDVSSALLRMTLVPDDADSVIAFADLANIEARVLAWLAGETESMKLFWEGGDPYMRMATVIFGDPSRWPEYTDPVTGKPLPLKKHPFRQTGKVVELGSGYQLGQKQFAVYAASNGIDLDSVDTTPEKCILGYRRSHPNIAGAEMEYKGHVYFRGGYWDKIEQAAIAAVEGGSASLGPIHFHTESGSLVVTLPSGRRLIYRGVKLESCRTSYGKDTVKLTYVSARFGPTGIYGGKWTENVVQAVSRDVLVHGAVLCERDGLPWVLHVHDEGAASLRADGPALVYKFGRFMTHITTCPDWLTNFPLDAEGSFAVRYAKTPGADWKAQFGKDEWVYRNGSRYK